MTKDSTRATTRKSPPAQNHPDALPDPKDIARRYLDLWQENLKYWATDPAALEKWLAENSGKKNSPTKE